MDYSDQIAFETSEVIARRQDELLCKQLTLLTTRSPYYARVLGDVEVSSKDIISVSDLAQLPFTTKDDLARYNNEFICVEPSAIVEYVTTSGTLGNPVTIALSERDLQRLAYNEFLSLSIAGGTRNDIYQIMITLDKRFMAGMAYYLGARKLGAGIIRSGVDSPAFQLDTIQRLNPTIIIAVPSFVRKLMEYAKTHQVDLKSSSIQRMICIGEPIRTPDFSLNPLAQQIQDEWPITLFSTYASTEMATAFTECSAGRGGHHLPELIVTELVDDDDVAVPDGMPGELVITTLGVEAMPLLRFKTGDICRRYPEPCSCGRNTYRLGPVEGRKQQMIKYKGTTLYPAALYDVLNSFSAVSNYVITLYRDSVGMDAIRVTISASDDTPALIDALKAAFLKSVRVVPEIIVATEAEVQQLTQTPLSRKVIRLLDERK
jgi:phenylacetate-CoA ligase